MEYNRDGKRLAEFTQRYGDLLGCIITEAAPEFAHHPILTKLLNLLTNEQRVFLADDIADVEFRNDEFIRKILNKIYMVYVLCVELGFTSPEVTYRMNKLKGILEPGARERRASSHRSPIESVLAGNIYIFYTFTHVFVEFKVSVPIEHTDSEINQMVMLPTALRELTMNDVTDLHSQLIQVISKAFKTREPSMTISVTTIDIDVYLSMQ